MNKKKMMASLMTALIMIGASACSADKNGTSITANSETQTEIPSETQTEIPSETQETNSTVTSVGNTASQSNYEPNLFGNPDFDNPSDRNLLHSIDMENPSITDIRSAYSVIDWMMYPSIVSGSNFTVEVFAGDRSVIPEKMTMYIFDYNSDYEWNTEDAYNVSESVICFPIIDSDYNTATTYYFNAFLPERMKSGQYTLVFVTPEGEVDSMWDFELIQPSESDAPEAID